MNSPEQPTRPDDVVTGFWLWVAALPLMVCAAVIHGLAGPGLSIYMQAATLTPAFIAAVLATVFLVLTWLGYRWARTLLVAGGAVSIGYATLNLFGLFDSSVQAVSYAVCAIVGSVLIAGGTFLLHRPEAQLYFNR